MTLHLTGLAAWWVQRASAVCMLVLFVLALVFLGFHPVHSHAQWRWTVSQPVVSLGVGAFFAALLSHMWVGLRDVLIDYARPAALRQWLLYLVGTALPGTALWVSWILVQAHA